MQLQNRYGNLLALFGSVFTQVGTVEKLSIEQLDSNHSKYKLQYLQHRLLVLTNNLIVLCVL